VQRDKITIHGPKNDGTYIVEFKTADGVALAFSVPKGGATAILEYCGAGCPTDHFKSPLLAKSPLVSAPTRRPSEDNRLKRAVSSATAAVTCQH
jgi:hypothetical protein